jgi:hypothetical protein
MANNPLDFDHMHQVAALRSHLGDEECRRFGFIGEDERGVTTVSAAGFGFLIFTAYEGTKSIAEAFAAGYACAADFYDPDASGSAN